MNQNFLHNLVFVFGSNANGQHNKGAALDALNFYGAVNGKAEGRSGSSYAIPTKDGLSKILALHDLKNNIDSFILHARENPEDLFQVTRIGCGISQYKDIDVASFFAKAPSNVFIPVQWEKIYKTVDSARIIVDCSDELDFEDIEKILISTTKPFNDKIEIITTCDNKSNDIIKNWTRRNNYPWTPIYADYDRFGKHADFQIHRQLAWYGTHYLNINCNYPYYKERSDILKSEELITKMINFEKN